MLKIKVDKKGVKKVIDEMELFGHTKEVVSEYQIHFNKLDDREKELNRQLEEIQEKHTQNLLDQETADVSELIYLKKMGRELVYETEVITSLLEQTNEEMTELKFHYAPLINKALSNDSTARVGKYDFSPLVDEVMGELLNAIAEVGMEFRKQYAEVHPAVTDVIKDKKVMERWPRYHYVFKPENYRPIFSKETVKEEDFKTAASGKVPSRFQQQDSKGVK
jgi:hypothetical protein